MKTKSWLKNIGLSCSKNECGHSGQRTLQLAVSKEGMNGINWYLTMLIQILKS